MARMIFKDLADIGLPFVTPDNPSFSALAQDIENRSLGRAPGPVGDQAAVLLNETAQTLIAFRTYVEVYRADRRDSQKYVLESRLKSSD